MPLLRSSNYNWGSGAGLTASTTSPSTVRRPASDVHEQVERLGMPTMEKLFVRSTGRPGIASTSFGKGPGLSKPRLFTNSDSGNNFRNPASQFRQTRRRQYVNIGFQLIRINLHRTACRKEPGPKLRMESSSFLL